MLFFGDVVQLKLTFHFMPTDPCFSWVPLLFHFYIWFIVYFPLLCASAITWYKDGRPLTSVAGLTLLKRGQALEIERAQLSDAGTYRCVAVNLAGDAEISVSLQVYGEICSSSRIKYHQHKPGLHFSSFESWGITLKHLLINVFFVFFMQCLRSFLAEAAQ